MCVIVFPWQINFLVACVRNLRFAVNPFKTKPNTRVRSLATRMIYCFELSKRNICRCLRRKKIQQTRNRIMLLIYWIQKNSFVFQLNRVRTFIFSRVDFTRPATSCTNEFSKLSSPLPVSSLFAFWNWSRISCYGWCVHRSSQLSVCHHTGWWDKYLRRFELRGLYTYTYMCARVISNANRSSGSMIIKCWEKRRKRRYKTVHHVHIS